MFSQMDKLTRKYDISPGYVNVPGALEFIQIKITCTHIQLHNKTKHNIDI